jgi:ATP adenylyltransferase
MQYLRAPEPGAEGCPLCAYAAAEPSRVSRVLARWPECVVVLNKYPYTSGHLMVLVRRHRGDIAELEDSEADQLWKMTHQVSIRLRRATRAQGLNIGVNLGRAAGAGIEEHLHVHVVPRWDGDCNFMPVLSETRVIPEYLEDTWDFLWPHFADLDSRTEPSR